MKRALIACLATTVLMLVSCGGGPSAVNSPVASKSQASIDPSGNWMMTAKDSGGVEGKFGMFILKSGSTVTNASAIELTGTSNSEPAEPSTFQCYSQPGDVGGLTLSNGLVQNVNQFSGTLEITDLTSGQSFGSFNFTATLATDGLSFTGTFANMPSCTGLAASGTYSGQVVPSVSGTWTGAVTPCTLSGSSCVGTLLPSEQATFTFTQDDTNGTVSGSYTISGDAVLSSGQIDTSTTFTVNGCAGTSPNGVFGPGTLSGTQLDFVWQENNASANLTSANIMKGTFDPANKTYTAIITVQVEGTNGCGAPSYRLVQLTQQ